MRYVKYTKVDRVTRKSVLEGGPCVNGPDNPSFQGLVEDFALESQWPTKIPVHFGTVDDDADLEQSGFLAELSEEEFKAVKAERMKARFSTEVANAEQRVKIDYASKIDAASSSLKHTKLEEFKLQRARDLLAGDETAEEFFLALSKDPAIKTAQDAINQYNDTALQVALLHQEMLEKLKAVSASKSKKALNKALEE